MASCTWHKEQGRYVCMAKHCQHWMSGGGCRLMKVSLSCDNEECIWNIKIADRSPANACKCMDVHLDAEGKCFGFQSKEVGDAKVLR